MQDKITNYLPELFIVVNQGGEYLDYFGGADLSGYQGVEDLNGRSLSDFFDRKTVEKIIKTIKLAINKNVISEIEYKIQSAGELVNQYYRASLSPVLDSSIYGEDCVIMSIQNITREIDAFYQTCKVTPFDTTLPVTNVFNLVAIDDTLMELDNRSQDRIAVIKLELKELNQIQAACSKEVKDNLEVTIIHALQNAIKFADHVIAREGFGSYWIGALVSEAVLHDVVSNAMKPISGKVVASRNPDFKIDAQVSLEFM